MDENRDDLGRFVAVDRADHPPHVTQTPWGTWRVRLKHRGELYDQSFGHDFDAALVAAARLRAALGIDLETARSEAARAAWAGRFHRQAVEEDSIPTSELPGGAG